MKKHKVAIGIGLGVLAVATGGAGLIAAGAFEATATATALGAAAVVSGGGAAARDAGDCARDPGFNGSCTAAGLGAVGAAMALAELGVTAGLWGESSYQGYLALSITGIYVGAGATLVDFGVNAYNRYR